MHRHECIMHVAIIKGAADAAIKLGDPKLALTFLRQIGEFKGNLTPADIAEIAPASPDMVGAFLEATKAQQSK